MGRSYTIDAGVGKRSDCRGVRPDAERPRSDEKRSNGDQDQKQEEQQAGQSSHGRISVKFAELGLGATLLILDAE
jgi:hypothetical protein